VTSAAQIEAFEETWHWNEQAEREFDELLHQANTSVADMMRALRDFLGEKLMDGWRSVSPKTSHVIAIRKMETPRMVARSAAECADGIFFCFTGSDVHSLWF
jgi:hypothetical protein